MKRLVAFFLLVLLAVPAFAVQPDEILPDPALESRARALSAQLRCLVCQNQSIDDSDAPLAKDLRVLIREHLTRGETDSQIMDYVVSRYGEYVLLKPRLSSRTIILWATPFVVLLLAALFLWRRRAPASSAEKPLSEAEKAELRQTLAKSE
jgi:cytochrome c-type biogenesis protein CcmH